ncbi:MAG: OmpA family protein [Crocinitomix sp.]|nr:OmpA family protein [Crocinitomix sp.]
MRSLLFFLVLSTYLNVSFGQEDIQVDLEINVKVPESLFDYPVNYQIHLYTTTDTFKLKTNQEGTLKLSTRDGLKIIEINRDYTYAIYRGTEYIGQDSFDTYTKQDTRIIRNLKHLEFTCTNSYYPIGFIDNTLHLTAQGKIDFERLSAFLDEHENIFLELYGMANSNTSGHLAVDLANKIRDSLIYEGHFPDRLQVNKPMRTDGELKVGFNIISFDYTPCTGGSVVNFDKTSDTIVETRCDSLKFIAHYIQLQEENFAIIGIYTDKANHTNKQKALERAAIVREKLIALGVDEKRIRATTSYHKPPGKDDHHDWPFYPEHFTYEIGVYVNGDY